MGLYHRIPRQLRSNPLRYLSLFFLIVLCIYIVVSLVGAADTTIKEVNDGAVRNNLESGQFTVFTPLSQSQMDEFAETGSSVEEMFYLDFELDDGSVLRVFQNREKINLVQAENGELPRNRKELLLEKLYAEAHDISIGSRIDIGGESFTVSGVGSSPDYDSLLQNIADVASEKQRFATAFVSKQAYRTLRDSGQSIQGEAYLYAYCLNSETTHEEIKSVLKGFYVDRDSVSDPYFHEFIDKAEMEKNKLLDGVASLVDGGVTLNEALDTLDSSGEDLVASFRKSGMPPQMLAAIEQYSGGVKGASDGAGELLDGLYELEDEAAELADKVFDFDIENMTSFLKAENNPRIAASADDVVINRMGGIIAGIIALLLFAYVISVFIVHSIDSDSEVIGTLYALGVSQGALLRHYLAIPAVISAAGGVCGTLLGFSKIGVTYMVQNTASYYSYPVPGAYYPTYLLLYGMVMPILVVLIVNWLVIRSRLARPPLALLKKESVSAKTGGVRIRNVSFVSLFRLRQILREKRASLTVCGCMFIAMLLLFLGINCYSFIVTIQKQNESDIRYEYMVSLKYPPENIPEGTTEAYLHSLSGEIYGTELDVSILGIGDKNPYFDFVPARGAEILTVSSSVANKYHLKTGDTVIFMDSLEDKSYVFTVDAIVPYSVGLYAFMDIESARSLFGAGDDEYNVLLSDTMPDIEAGRVYSITTRNDILGYGDIFMKLMTPMIITMVSAAAIVLIIVMYLMMKMMVDRSSFGISLIKIFGFNDGEVRKLYLDGNLLTVILGTIVGLPLAKIVIDAIYPVMISNVALGPDMTLIPWLYAAIVALVFVSYFFINLLLNRRLKEVSFGEVLKQRE